MDGVCEAVAFSSGGAASFVAAAASVAAVTSVAASRTVRFSAEDAASEENSSVESNSSCLRPGSIALIAPWKAIARAWLSCAATAFDATSATTASAIASAIALVTKACASASVEPARLSESTSTSTAVALATTVGLSDSRRAFISRSIARAATSWRSRRSSCVNAVAGILLRCSAFVDLSTTSISGSSIASKRRDRGVSTRSESGSFFSGLSTFSIALPISSLLCLKNSSVPLRKASIGLAESGGNAARSAKRQIA